jgi:hypothetical protein
MNPKKAQASEQDKYEAVNYLNMGTIYIRER